MSSYDPNNPYGGGPQYPGGQGGQPPAGSGYGNPPGGYGQVPQGSYGQPPYNPYSSPMQPGGPGGTTPAGTVVSLVLGILSLATIISCCCIYLTIPGTLVGIGCGITAMILGSKGLQAVEAGEAPVTSRGVAQAGRICGIVGLSLNSIALVVVILAFAGFISLAIFSQTPSTNFSPGTNDPFGDPLDSPTDPGFDSGTFEPHEFRAEPFDAESFDTEPLTPQPFGAEPSTTEPPSGDWHVDEPTGP